MKPSGAGPHPAVVLMHGCSGIFPRHVTWARRLKDLGYVTLILDSLRPRSLFNICFGPPGSASPGKRALDAHGALAYLQGLPYVDAARVGVIGWSHGAMSALAAVRASGIAERLPQQFKAVIAFYPLCRGGARFEVPTLILIGEADDWTPSRLCRALVAQNRNGTVPLDLVIYPGAYHGFDVTELAKGYQLEGPAGLSYWLQYDKAAHDDAVERVVDFLADHLSR